VKQVFCRTEAEVDQQVGDPTALIASSPSWPTSACHLFLPGSPLIPAQAPQAVTPWTVATSLVLVRNGVHLVDMKSDSRVPTLEPSIRHTREHLSQRKCER
jgi:hypothetical protein